MDRFLQFLIIAAICHLNQLSPALVFDPHRIIRAEFEPQIPDECRKPELDYCERVPNYLEKQMRLFIKTLGDDLKKSFVAEELDIGDVQTAPSNSSEEFLELCDAIGEIIVPEAVKDRNGKWHFVPQDRKNNITQRYRGVNCKTNNQEERGCYSLLTLPPDHESKCVQKYVYRTILIVAKNHTVAQLPFHLPSCCACMTN